MPKVNQIGRQIPLKVFAERIGIRHTQAIRMAREGRIPGVVHIGSRYFIGQKAMDAYMNGDSPKPEPHTSVVAPIRLHHQRRACGSDAWAIPA
jgi:predicted site-specific integrase-resolvase